MKISVFFDLYEPFHETKDPGEIPLGLMDNGVNAGVITVTKKALEGYNPKFQVTQRTLNEFYSAEFWAQNDSDAVIAYPLQGALYSPLIEKMKAGRKKVLLKFDSDGKIAYPLQRHSQRIPLSERLTVRNVVSDLWWRLPSKSLKYRKHAKVAAETIKQLDLCDAAIIESPDALSNLNFFLSAWERSDLTKKTHFVPNPVTFEFLEGEVAAKENVAVTHGRWDDSKVKNTAAMAETVVSFLKARKDYRFIIFGSGIDTVKTLIKDAPEDVKSRIEVLGYLQHKQVKETLQSAKVLFVPSRWESFSIASAEALCRGCSIVGTPVEALRYLSMQGFSGTTAATFDSKALLAALLQDTKKWDDKKYEPKEIAAFWRPKLDRKTIAKSIETLAKEN